MAPEKNCSSNQKLTLTLTHILTGGGGNFLRGQLCRYLLKYLKGDGGEGKQEVKEVPPICLYECCGSVCMHEYVSERLHIIVYACGNEFGIL